MIEALTAKHIKALQLGVREYEALTYEHASMWNHDKVLLKNRYELQETLREAVEYLTSIHEPKETKN